MDEVSGEEGVYAATMYHIRGRSKPKAFEVTVELCGEPHKLEIDTGATRTVLNEETYNKLRDILELKNSKAILSTYTGEKIPVSGEVLIPVKYQNQLHNLSAMVAKSPGPNLLGRDWLQLSDQAKLEQYFQHPGGQPSAAEDPRCTQGRIWRRTGYTEGHRS